MKVKAPKKIWWCQILGKVVDNKDKQNHCEVEFIRKGSELKGLLKWIKKQFPCVNRTGFLISDEIYQEIERRMKGAK